MPQVLDTFMLEILPAETETPGSTQPLAGRVYVPEGYEEQTTPPGGPYGVNFTYRVGYPYSTADFEISWLRGVTWLTGDGSAPSYEFSPTAPVRTTEAWRYFPASVSGNMPQETGRYTGIIKMTQP